MAVHFVHYEIFTVGRDHRDFVPSAGPAERCVDLPVSKAILVDNEPYLRERLSLGFVH